MNDVSLRDYVDTRIKSLEDKIDGLSEFSAQHFKFNELAIKKAEDSMLARLATMNGFQVQLREERVNFATKEELMNLDKSNNARVKKLEEANVFSAGKMWMVMAIFAAIPIVIALFALLRG